ncbi:UPF0132 membrane protein [Smittium mucronatum]|uniref:UPF0132 membrane protein n=1 Tax=Smittium mucronatum TaxID=133383 RepID=A0A1R0GM33_9FUNG|nr:UPF0132 membrane protein [Smittium mucronatum]
MESAPQTYTPVGDGNFNGFGLPEGGGETAANQSATDLYFSEGVLSFLCYFFGVVPSVIALVYERKSEYVRFHAWQALILSVVVYVLLYLLSFSTFLTGVFAIVSFVALIYAGYKSYVDATTHELFKLPYIGNLAENQVYGLSSLPF